MFIHNQKLNPCKCGSKKQPLLDSDDFTPCWLVRCRDCGQVQNGIKWTLEGAVKKWNEENKTNNYDF